jgi:hypothetical protein
LNSDSAAVKMISAYSGRQLGADRDLVQRRPSRWAVLLVEDPGAMRAADPAAPTPGKMT